MNYNAIFFLIIPFLLMAVISVGMPFYRVKILREAGKLLIPLVRSGKARTIITYAIAYILLILSFLIDFGKMNFVLPYCAVLGLYISTKDGSFRSINGAYENLLINGTDIIRYKDINLFPMDDYTAEERSHYPDNVLIIITKKGVKRQLTFQNSNEIAEVLPVIKKQMQV